MPLVIYVLSFIVDRSMKVSSHYVLPLIYVNGKCLNGIGRYMSGYSAMGSETADLTVSMLLNLAYFVGVCWIIPVIPIMIVLMCGWPFAAFLALWLIGLPFIGYALYYFFLKGKG